MSPGRLLALAAGLGLAPAAFAAAGGYAVPPPPQYIQNLGFSLAPQSRWTDERGRSIALASCFGGRPSVVMFGYFKCPQLCSVLERNIVDELREVAPTVGRDYNFIYLDIDPADGPGDARAERDGAVLEYGRGTPEGWHYLTGTDASIRQAAAAAGFEFRFDPVIRQYSHPSGVLVLTPAGRISRYFLGLDFPPSDLADAIRRAGRGGIGEPVFNVILECFHGAGLSGRYGPLIWRAMEVAVTLSLAGLAGLIVWLVWEERARRAARP